MRGEVVAAAGEDLELECISTGANPAPILKWYMITRAGQMEEVPGARHSQENTRPSPEARTWTSISRLNLPVSKEDNGAKIKCLAEHEALTAPLDSITDLTIHCELNIKEKTSILVQFDTKKRMTGLNKVAHKNNKSRYKS